MTTRILGLLMAISALVFFGCGTSEMDPVSNDLAQLAPAQTGGTVSGTAAESFTEVLFIPFDLLVNVPCANGGAGEDIQFSGILHETFHVTVNGNRFRIKIIDNPQGISGVGSVTGDKYQATGMTQESLGGSFVNGSFTDTYVNSFKIIGQSTNNNFLVQETLHITINADGTVTAFVDNVSTVCK